MNSFTRFPAHPDFGDSAEVLSDVAGRAWMPPRSPLDMPVQDFTSALVDPAASPKPENRSVWRRRWATLLPAIGLTFLVVGALATRLGADGLSALEALWLGLILVTFFWIAATFASAVLGVLSSLRSQHKVVQSEQALTIAVVSPIYNESPSHVFGNVAAMAEQLQNLPTLHRYAFFLISDTQDPAVAAKEEETMRYMRENGSLGFPIYYRRRMQNTDRKTGNIAHWIHNWGGAYDAMLVFDADSVMSGEGIKTLSDTLASDPSLALVQTCPRLFGSDTFFGRMQQFASAAFGLFPSLGEAAWSQDEANYHGHNAIVRTKAFATCAGLPYLKNRKGGDTLIFSHDFVEAALLRRAGWGVRMVPELQETYEETPTTLIDYVLRDRRWCQGNMQHLRILGSAGLHPVSRFHLGQNALTYLMSPAWFALVLIGALLGTSSHNGLLSFVTGQPASAYINFAMFDRFGLWLLGFVYLLLVAPKVAGAIKVLLSGGVSGFGGAGRFGLGFVTELIGSMAIAPILMVQQTRAIFGIVVGQHENWGPQQRYESHYTMATILRFHWFETAFGVALAAGMALNFVSLWLLPIAISLAGAPLLSYVSGIKMGAANNSLFATPDAITVPQIIQQAAVHRDAIEGFRPMPETPQMAAE